MLGCRVYAGYACVAVKKFWGFTVRLSCIVDMKQQLLTGILHGWMPGGEEAYLSARRTRVHLGWNISQINNKRYYQQTTIKLSI
jgi:hypothetical protein